MPNITRSERDPREVQVRIERNNVKLLAAARKRNKSLILEMDEEDDEDEIALAVPIRPKKRRPLAQWNPEELRKESVRIVNGTLTPVTDNEGRNGSFPDSSGLSSAAKPSDEDTNLIALTRPMKLTCEVSDDEAARAEARKLFVHPSTSAYPHWMYRGSELKASQEHRAVASLQIAFHKVYPPTQEVRPDYTYFTLDDFTIYQLPGVAWHANELVTLEKLTMARKSEFLFAGTLSFGNRRIFVKDISFDVLTLEYGDDSRPWNDRVCIQSRIAKEQNFYYKLGQPALEYQRFYTPFLVLAQFTDYFIGYMCEHENVTIAHFRSQFWSWLQAAHGEDESFLVWHKRIRLLDFRTLVAVNVEFLWKECWDIGSQSAGTSEPIALCENPLWGEIHPDRLKAIPTQPVDYASKTVVTPFAYACFQSMYFADMLGMHTLSEENLRERVNARKRSLGLTPTCCGSFPAQELIKTQPLRKVTDVRAGDVVVVLADKTGDWKLSTADFWYAYVQRIWTDRKGSRRLDVIWLYQPEDTTIGNAFYPYKQELFLSDNCGCGKQEALYLDDVEDLVGKANVSWFADDPSAQKGFFVRRTFRTVPELNQYDFVKLHKHHFCCCHQDNYIDRSVVTYKVGDAVLVERDQDTLGRNCEPAVIVDFSNEQGRDYVLLRKLESAVEAEKKRRARPNELIVTDEEFLRPRDDIVRPCQVRIFDRDQIQAGKLPTPYDRDGTGDYFYIARDSGLAELTLNESWSPCDGGPKRKLTGLGIFCGGGTFDRGLEEGGAVRFRYAVDLAEKALYSCRANDPEPDSTAYYLGSVNEYLASAMMSRQRDLVAQPGAVDIISAGSPCQGFSRMQRDQQSDRSRRNASMVASVISYVDLYAPRYLVLENVVAMTNNVKGLGEQNVFSQMIAALVGLGYQVQQFLMDSYYYGSSQGRSRVFIIATAPTCAVLDQPEYTHRRPLHLERRGNLGRCSNGKPFGSRREDAYTPFAQVSAQDSVTDLPVIHDGQPFLCPSHPDHRTATEETATNRTRMAVVPQRPFGMSLVQAAQAGLVRGEPLEFSHGKNQIKCGPGSRSFRRVFPDRPFPTILTKLSVGDGMNGQAVHWNQHRVLSIMECRRAQGFPEHEVLVGLPTERMKIVGNSVDRKVALVLGLAVRDSWLKSPPVDKVPVLIDESAAGMLPAGLGDAEGDHAEFDTD